VGMSMDMSIYPLLSRNGDETKVLYR